MAFLGLVPTARYASVIAYPEKRLLKRPTSFCGWDTTTSSSGLRRVPAIAREDFVRSQERARRLAEDSSENIINVLTRLGLISERELAEAFAEIAGSSTGCYDGLPEQTRFGRRLSDKFLKDARVIPLFETRPMSGYYRQPAGCGSA